MTKSRLLDVPLSFLLLRILTQRRDVFFFLFFPFSFWYYIWNEITKNVFFFFHPLITLASDAFVIASASSIWWINPAAFLYSSSLTPNPLSPSTPYLYTRIYIYKYIKLVFFLFFFYIIFNPLLLFSSYGNFLIFSFLDTFSSFNPVHVFFFFRVFSFFPFLNQNETFFFFFFWGLCKFSIPPTVLWGWEG